ncbi:MAG: hypothetical protein RO469_13670 [Thermincola sp.]|nr:hypothetical protein [Thermincola sp.]MDT3704112.1 hypothetical protein [Thermincola sp.]
MAGFRRKLFGYRRQEVDDYFATMEREHHDAIARKQAELENLLQANENLRLEISSLTKKVESLNQSKLQLVDSLNSELESIDVKLQQSQAEAQARKMASLQKLREKRDEVVHWYSVLQQLQEELQTLQQGYNGRMS